MVCHRLIVGTVKGFFRTSAAGVYNKIFSFAASAER